MLSSHRLFTLSLITDRRHDVGNACCNQPWWRHGLTPYFSGFVGDSVSVSAPSWLLPLSLTAANGIHIWLKPAPLINFGIFSQFVMNWNDEWEKKRVTHVEVWWPWPPHTSTQGTRRFYSDISRWIRQFGIVWNRLEQPQGTTPCNSSWLIKKQICIRQNYCSLFQ